MDIQAVASGATLHLDHNEVQLLELALRRATFEDTPAASQDDILDFALRLLRHLEVGYGHAAASPSTKPARDGGQ